MLSMHLSKLAFSPRLQPPQHCPSAPLSAHDLATGKIMTSIYPLSTFRVYTYTFLHFHPFPSRL